MVEAKGIEPSDSNLARITRNPITAPKLLLVLTLSNRMLSSISTPALLVAAPRYLDQTCLDWVVCNLDLFLGSSRTRGDYVQSNFWLRGKDSNLRPLGYEPSELPLLHPAKILSGSLFLPVSLAFDSMGFSMSYFPPRDEISFITTTAYKHLMSGVSV